LVKGLKKQSPVCRKWTKEGKGKKERARKGERTERKDQSGRQWTPSRVETWLTNMAYINGVARHRILVDGTC
jgi:hypothetical protein